MAAIADQASTHRPCKPDSSGADWFKCARGTVGCPYVHDGRTPHCIACTAGEPCQWRHDPPALEGTWASPSSERSPNTPASTALSKESERENT